MRSPGSPFARWRWAFVQVHLWLGLVSGLYLSLVCVTGAALVFRIELQRTWYPRLFTPSAPGVLVDPATVMDHVQRAYPAARLAGVDVPTTERPTYLAYATSGSDFLTVLIDPATARVLGELPDRSFVRTIQDLHFDLLAGQTGRIVNGIGAGCLLTMCVTGLVLWWPVRGQWRRAFSIDVRRSWRRLVWDLHRAIGVWTLAALIMWAITGLYFIFPSPFRAVIRSISPLSSTRPPTSGPAPVASGPAASASATPAARPTWRALIERARQERPGQHVARVVVPSSAQAAFQVLFSEESPTPVGRGTLTSVYLDQFTGDVLPTTSTRRTPGDAMVSWLGALHVGHFGGLATKVAWVAFGLAPPLLFFTGFVLWWTRITRPRDVGGEAQRVI